ncbi:uncharacterized protein [Maniola hyperantus]|uniref:uncharacterized protein n=1 Tax=Aphantopus hyperantus TaxID=2795564 RepID=UPI003748017C
MSLEEQNLEATLRDLTAKRSSFKGRLTKFKNNLELLSSCKSISPVEISKLSIKLSRFETLFTDFDELQTQIEVFNVECLDAELNIRETIEQDFCFCIATAQQLIDANSTPKKQNNSSHSCHDHDECDGLLGFKLPTIKISNFDGSYYKWLEFKDTFVSLVHDNTRIKDIHKFYYLNSYLEGEAARVISNLEVSDKNYSEAWQLLCERYDNKRQLINNHLKALFSVDSVRETEKSFRFIIDHVTKNLRALHTLGLPTESWDVIVIFLISQKLDPTTSFKWEESRSSLKDIPTLDDFFQFLKNRADVFETIKGKRRDSILPSPKAKKEFTKSFSATSSPSKSKVNLVCPVCKGKHRIYECLTFKNKSPEDRSALVSSLGLCRNCLRRDHNVDQCRLPGGCRICKQRHNSLVHVNASEGEEEAVALETVTMSSTSETEVLLCTALIDILNPSTNEKITVRALLDSGSQSSFLTTAVKQRLGLSSQKIDTKIIGIGDTKLNVFAERCLVRIKSKHSSFNVTISCLILPKLTGQLPKVAFNTKGLNISNFQLADPTFNIPSDIDVILGAELFWCIIGTEQHSLGEHHPILRSSKLGWLIAGPIGPSKKAHKSKPAQETSCNLVSCDSDLSNEITKFWELEKVPTKTSYTEEERHCEKHFLQNTYRCDDGRFCVRIPLRCDKDCLGNSYALAERRFFNLERRFIKQPVLKQLYVEFIKEYADLKHLSVYDKPPSETSFYLPHHPVLKLTSESSKIRVVYDGSAQTTSGFSVNDLQMVGPNIQDSLFNILVRFRQHKYVLSADIEKMYRSIMVDESDRDLQLILWREQESQPLMTLQLNTVTYGLSSSSFLSTRCLWQCGEECGDAATKTVIQNDFYVDDLLTGATTEEELLHIQRSVSDALAAGGFRLRKYRSNSKLVNSGLLQESSSSKGHSCPCRVHLYWILKLADSTDFNGWSRRASTFGSDGPTSMWPNYNSARSGAQGVRL